MRTITTIIMTIAVSITAWSQTYHWATPAGGSNNDIIRDMAIHPDGDFWIIATYESTAIFGSHTVTGSSSRNVVVARYDDSGDVSWITNFPVTSSPAENFADYRIDIDENKNVYICLTIEGNPTVDGVNFPKMHHVAKLNQQGAVQWSVYAEDNHHTAYFTGIKVLNSGKVLVGGYANTNSTSFSIGGKTIDDTQGGNIINQAFLMLVDSDGTVEWIRSNPSVASFIGGGHKPKVSLYEDNAGNLYTAGTSRNGYTGATIGYYLSKFEPDGTHLWSRFNTAVPGSDNNTDYVLGLHGNGTDRVYMFYSNSSLLQDFGEGATLTLEEGSLGYHATFDDSGTCLSIVPFSDLDYSISGTSGHFINIDGCLYEDNGDFHLYGEIVGSLTIDGTTYTSDIGLANALSADALVLHLNSDFTLNDIVLNTGTHSEHCRVLYRTGEDTFIFAGTYTGYSHPFYGTFQPKFGPHTLPFYGNRDIFIASYTLGGGSVSTEEFNALEIKMYPNPAKDVFYIETPELSENTSVQIFDLSGKLLLQQKITDNQTTIDIQGLNSGVYLVRTANNQGTSTQKLIVR